VLISICIPAYKHTGYLKRLLDSIHHQSFREFEVIVTDDSPDESVRELTEAYKMKFKLVYKRNIPALGTPENWNEAIRYASGQWIKLMHDDDWFSDSASLARFTEAVRQHPWCNFFFSAYTNVYQDSNKRESVYLSEFRKRKLLSNPVTLISKNVIGPPSVILFRNEKKMWFDSRFKWVVDIDYYIRFLQNEKPVYLNETLINVGVNNDQVTKYTFRVPEVEIPENFGLLEKTGIKHLHNLLIYDAWWRIVRNLRIGHVSDIRKNGYAGNIHPVIRRMIEWQSKIPAQLLKKGIISKTIMFVHFLVYRRLLNT